jgi:translation initiation factor 3 subunit E
MIEKYLSFGKFLYETGKYTLAIETLKQYYSVCPESENSESIQWGIYSSTILNSLNGTTTWDASLTEMNNMQSFIDGFLVENSVQLQRRLWFIHWSLFVFFNHAKGRESLIEVLFQEK